MRLFQIIFAVALVVLTLVQGAQTWRLYHNSANVVASETETSGSLKLHVPFLFDPDAERSEGQLAAHIEEVYRLSQEEIRDLLASLPGQHLSSCEKLLARAACERLGQLGGREASQAALAKLPEEMRWSVTGLIPLDSTEATIQRLVQERPPSDPQLSAYFKALARQDPTRAFELIVSLAASDKQGRHPYFGRFFESLVGVDPEQAFDIAQGLDGKKGHSWLVLAAEAWAEKDPKTALAGIAARADESSAWASAIGTAIGRWAYEDLDGALRHFVDAFPELATSETSLAYISRGAAAHDAASLIEASRILPESVQARWLSMLDSNSMSIAEAVAILEAIPRGKHHMNASESIASRMASDNWEGMLAWVDGLEYPESHDATLLNLTRYSYNDEDTQIDLYQRMRDQQAAQETARHRFQRWKSEDAIGAEQWLKNSQVVSPEMRKALSSP